MSSDHAAFADWDGAYVLGALTPADRRAYEEHLDGCVRCRAAIGELASIPGLLARTTPPDDDSAGPPADLVDLVAARRDRRRRTVLRRFTVGLGVAAVDLAAAQFGTLIAEAAESARGAAQAARAAIEALTSIVSRSDYRLGCPVSVVTLEMGAESERLRHACASAFDSWIVPTAALLEADGIDAEGARSLATVIVATIEGAVIVSRAMRSPQPLESAADVVADLIEQRIRTAAVQR